MQSYTCSLDDYVLVWSEKIVNSRIGELLGTLNVLQHDERSKTFPIDQDRVIKRYSASQIRPLLEQPSMLDDSITERKIEGRHNKPDREPYEPEFDGDNVQLNVDQQSYGEQSITHDGNTVTKKSQGHKKSKNKRKALSKTALRSLTKAQQA